MCSIQKKFITFITCCIGIFFVVSCNSGRNISSIQQQESKKKDIVDVAILLPITGDQSASCKEYVEMIKMGLSNSAKAQIRVTTYDSTTTTILERSLDTILDSGTDIIIGSIDRESTKIVANRVKETNIIVISFSNDPMLASRNIYIFGLTPMRQLEQITNYFLNNHYQNYVALLPVGRNSSMIDKILRDMISKYDREMVYTEFYTDIPEEVGKSVSLVSKKIDALNENDLNLKQTVILLDDQQCTLKLLYKYMRQFYLDKKAIIVGDHRLNTGPSTLDIIFTGSIRMFEADFTSAAAAHGIHDLSFMHAIAYDAGSLVSKYIGNNYNYVQFITHINDSTPFVGVSGVIHFTDSIVQRQYDILKKENGKVRLIHRASVP